MQKVMALASRFRPLAVMACFLVLTAGASAQTTPVGAPDLAASAPNSGAASQVVLVPTPESAPAVLPSASAPVLTTSTAAVTIKRPAMLDVDKISGADTAWMLTSTALVLLMTLPGIALFYAGMVRKKNVINTLACVMAVAAVVTVGWFALSYSLSFTPGNGFLGGLDRALFDGFGYVKDKGRVMVSHAAPNVPESVYAMFQLTFAIITTALVIGAMVERMKFGALVLFAIAWPVLVYAPIAHWVWEPGGWLAQLGVLDFAGGSVVHINAGVAGLVLAYFLGPRLGYGKEPFEPFNLGLTMAGTGLLWVGWFGFNAGSAVAADGRAGLAMLVTQLAAATAALTWGGIEWLNRGKCSLLGLCSGAVAGLVAITPASGYVTASSSVFIGVAAGIVCYWGATQFKRRLRVDDSLDVFGIHAMGGLTGAVLTGVFNDPHISGAVASFPLQLLGSLAVGVYSLVVTGALLIAINITVGLRVHESDEIQGLDVSAHRERIGG